MTNVAWKSTKSFALSYLRDYRNYLNIDHNIFKKYENVNVRFFKRMLKILPSLYKLRHFIKTFYVLLKFFAKARSWRFVKKNDKSLSLINMYIFLKNMNEKLNWKTFI